ncbi:outer membrane beta-barrel protein [Celeribacter persicus]|uniref:Outer membrane protein with beta-barrel domain n=1 Tax=Celeribacter persicus TaxID=1651082 RepID=A0A2T5HS17_9RHOB|nr:outer membrane beta-barrel protein [Celeribacter persicus]PTQ74372.1 outer membrane protein with beta-barrel domain [Celeribacter persicus]
MVNKTVSTTIGSVVFASGATMLGFVAPAMAQDFTGFYAGLSGAFPFDSEMTYNFSDTDDLSGVAPGFFTGYNADLGGWVLGGEVAFNGGLDLDGIDGAGIDNMVDLKAKFGRVFGKTYVYGILGYSKGEPNTTIYGNDAKDVEVEGMNYGVGVETMLKGSAFVGLELLSRDLDVDGTVYGGDADPYYVGIDKLTTASVRVGFRF